jgi:NitT/TauT family transport system permease protein
LRTRFDAILVVAAALGVWQALVTLTHTHVVPGPVQVARGLAELWRRGLLVRYTLDSLGRVGAGYGLALILGLAAGMWMGLSRFAEALLDPLVQLLRPVSPIAWIPVAIVLFGIGEGAPFFLIALAAFFPIASATAAAVRRVPPMYVAAGRNFGLTGPRLIVRVVLPAALPSILASLRIAFGVAWLVVVAAEMIAVDSGLGYLIIDSRNAGKRYDLVVAGMLLVGLVGLALDVVFRRLERLRWLRWGFRVETTST